MIVLQGDRLKKYIDGADIADYFCWIGSFVQR